MYQKLEGLKTTLWSGLVVSLAFIAVNYTQVYWQNKISLIEQIIHVLFVVGILFSAQFGRSRFALLIFLWFIYYLVEYQHLSGRVWLHSEQQWLFLSGIFCFALLAVIKDRGVLSVHGILRVVAVLLCAALAKVWLLAVTWLAVIAKEQVFYFSRLEYLSIDIPLYLTALFILYKSIRAPNLLVASLLTSLILWTLINNQQLTLPLSISIAVLLIHYILVVVIDSYFLAYRDELTGLPSRRALNQYALSLGGKYSTAMLDIDHFKKFNDNYGHDIGDQVLKLVAVKLAQVKGGGKVFRYGGEEFTVVFPRKNSSDVLPALEQIRQAVADYKITIRHPIRKNKKARKASQSNAIKTVSVTISIGVSTRENKQSFDQTIKKADEALYRAKKKGRNNVSS